MQVSYNGLWKILIDKNMQKKDLVEKLKLSSTTVAKMGRGEPVSFKVLEKICNYLECEVGDIISFNSQEFFNEKCYIDYEGNK